MEKLHIVKTKAQLADLCSYLKTQTYTSFDIETTGVEKGSEIIGISVCSDVEEAYYVILSYWDVAEQRLIALETQEIVLDLLHILQTKPLIAHNAVFDCSMIGDRYGVDLMPSVHTDTMILAQIVDENRSVGLKDLGVSIFGEDAKAEQVAMKESVTKNGGTLTKAAYELYKGDADLIALYGAKDALLTLKLFYHLVPQLYEEGMEQFFYEDESMPLLRGPTYQLNTTGLKVDPDRLTALKATLEAECLEAKAFIYKEITPHVQHKYPGTNKKNGFNIGSSSQLAWLLFSQLGNEFGTLTKGGRELCKTLGLKLPYAPKDKRAFLTVVSSKVGQTVDGKKIREPWNYIACGKETLAKLSGKYKWVAEFLKYAKNMKLLSTYVEGIQEKMRYNVIRPQFLQHGTTSGRYSSKSPNFQNLPRDDKRIKACIVSRPGKSFVGADYSQLEPRVFASFSGDERLLKCFADGDDFYSVIGTGVFGLHGMSHKKDMPGSFADQHPDLRNVAKAIALSAAYGNTAPKMATMTGKRIDEAQEIIDDYFLNFPSVKTLMLDSHEQAKTQGHVTNLFGRKRRMPEALLIARLYGKTQHKDLPYEARNVLNLAMNHRIQSTGASIMNRAAITVYTGCQTLAGVDPRWLEVKIVLQVHDELILEAPDEMAENAALLLKSAMENTVRLPGVALIANPKIAKDIAGLK